MIEAVIRLGKYDRRSAEADLEIIWTLDRIPVYWAALSHRPCQVFLDLNEVEDAIAIILRPANHFPAEHYTRTHLRMIPCPPNLPSSNCVPKWKCHGRRNYIPFKFSNEQLDETRGLKHSP